MLQGVSARRDRFIGVAHRERDDPRESADVLPLDGAAGQLASAGVVEKKLAVTFFDIGVAVPAGRGEKVEIPAGVIVEIVAALFNERFLQLTGEL